MPLLRAPKLLPRSPKLRPTPLLLRPLTPPLLRLTPLPLRLKKRSKSQPSGALTETKRAVFPTGRPPFSLGAYRRRSVGGQDRRNQRKQDEGDEPAQENEPPSRSEEHTSELQSLMRNSSAVFCL